MSNAQIIEKYLEELSAEIVAKYNEKGMRASGQFAETINVEATDSSGAIWAEDYSQQLEEGRPPTSGSGNGSLLDRIKQWISDKGISSSDISEDSLAYLITRKIHRMGWNRSGYGGVNLISEVLTPQRLDKLFNDLSSEIIDNELIQIEKQWQSLLLK
jgi:hypothetical protein